MYTEYVAHVFVCGRVCLCLCTNMWSLWSFYLITHVAKREHLESHLNGAECEVYHRIEYNTDCTHILQGLSTKRHDNDTRVFKSMSVCLYGFSLSLSIYHSIRTADAQIHRICFFIKLTLYGPRFSTTHGKLASRPTATVTFPIGWAKRGTKFALAAWDIFRKR